MVRKRPAVYKRVRVEDLPESRGLGVVGHILLVVVLPAFLLGLGYVKLTSDQVALRRELTEMRRTYALRTKEQTNLELEVEMFRNGARIFSQVERLGLGLQMPARGQVIRVRDGASVSQARGLSAAPPAVMVADR